MVFLNTYIDGFMGQFYAMGAFGTRGAYGALMQHPPPPLGCRRHLFRNE